MRRGCGLWSEKRRLELAVLDRLQQTVLFHFVAEGVAADAESFCGMGLIALRFIESADDQLTFVFGKGRILLEGGGLTRQNRGLFAMVGRGVIEQRRWQIGKVDFCGLVYCGLGHHGGVADGVFQFANIAGPGVMFEGEARTG